MYVLCYYFDMFHISLAMLLHEIGGMNEYVCMYLSALKIEDYYGLYLNSVHRSMVVNQM